MKRKALLVFGAIALVLVATAGGLAAGRYIITKSSQVKNGAIGYKDLSRGAKKKLRGHRGPPGQPGAPGGPAGPSGPPGPAGTDALEQFGGHVDPGQTMCIGVWGSNHQGPCLTSNYASDNNARVFGPMPAGLTIQNFSVGVSQAPNVGSMVITVLDNGAATAITCTIPKGSTSCSDGADSFLTSAGDFL